MFVYNQALVFRPSKAGQRLKIEKNRLPNDRQICKLLFLMSYKFGAKKWSIERRPAVGGRFF
jgi:hypothetical protein